MTDDPPPGAGCTDLDTPPGTATACPTRFQLSPRPDPLTRLLMRADGVSEAELSTLLLEVLAARTPGP